MTKEAIKREKQIETIKEFLEKQTKPVRQIDVIDATGLCPKHMASLIQIMLDQGIVQKDHNARVSLVKLGFRYWLSVPWRKAA